MPRITQGMLVSNYLINTNRNLNNMQNMQSQLSTGKEISKPSENPFKATRIMQLYTEIDSNKQFNENIKDTSNWLDATDTALGQAQNILARIRELQVSVGNGTYKENERVAIQVEIKQKSEELIQVLNTNFDGSYIFGGTKSETKPVTLGANGEIRYSDKDGNAIYEVTSGARTDFTSSVIENTGKTAKVSSVLSMTAAGIQVSLSDGSTPITFDNTGYSPAASVAAWTAAGFSSADFDKVSAIASNASSSLSQISSDLKTEVSEGVLLDYNISANEVLEYAPGKSVTDLLKNIINNLQPEGSMITNLDGTTGVSDPSKVSGQLLTEMDKMISNLLNKRSKVGVLSNRMESSQIRNEADNESMTNILSKTEDIDYAEKMMEYSVLQTVYQASLQVSGKVLPLTIMNYL